MVRKTRSLNLRFEEISIDKIEEILEKISIEIDKYIKSKTPPKTSYDLVLRVDKDHELTLIIDIGIKGSYEEVFNYESIVNDVVNLSRRIFEKEIEKYRV
ncbi:MAG: hypothetical protein QXX35_02170 [Desulfurococcaceae archaeon]|uniref:DUF3194 domain-containing protein n=1 Tax=Staphylothermus marinus TaxID=2280 RepID=A0A7C4H8H7_STAMA